MAEIGKPLRIIETEPVKEPAEAPSREPVPVDVPEKEKVGSR